MTGDVFVLVDVDEATPSTSAESARASLWRKMSVKASIMCGESEFFFLAFRVLSLLLMVNNNGIY